jgi:hypothetical protein
MKRFVLYHCWELRKIFRALIRTYKPMSKWSHKYFLKKYPGADMDEYLIWCAGHDVNRN